MMQTNFYYLKYLLKGFLYLVLKITLITKGTCTLTHYYFLPITQLLATASFIVFTLYLSCFALSLTCIQTCVKNVLSARYLIKINEKLFDVL